MLQARGSQRVRHDLRTEQQQREQVILKHRDTCTLLKVTQSREKLVTAIISKKLGALTVLHNKRNVI